MRDELEKHIRGIEPLANLGKLRACAAVLVFPFASPSAFAFAEKITIVVSSTTSQTILVSGGVSDSPDWPDNVQIRDVGVRLHHIRDRTPKWLSMTLWGCKLILAQIRMAGNLVRLRHEIDIVLCALGCYYQLPILTAKLLGKKTISASTGLDAFSARLNYGRVGATVMRLLAWFDFALSDAIVVESLRLGTHKDLVPFRSKLCHGALFLTDLDRFQLQIPVQERENLVGYIGRMTAEKGVLEFVRAIPLALERRPDLHFLLLGTGKLDDAIEETMRGEPWSSKVTWLKWVEHQFIPDYLNKLKLVVVPSYTEGLPNLAMEAMGCGTPVLATAVGGIPDLITEGETGLLLRDNSPAAIAHGIIRAVSYPNIDTISQQARTLIVRDYSLSAATNRYEAIIHDTLKGHQK